MKKREKANENHKASIRRRVRKNKELYMSQIENGNEEAYDFPKMSDKDLNELKTKLKRERKREKISTILIVILVFLIGILFMIYTRRYF